MHARFPYVLWKRFATVIFCLWCAYGAYTQFRRWNIIDKGQLSKKSDNAPLKFEPGLSQQRVVFYNRIGKCGSRTFIGLSRMLAKTNNFTFSESKDYEHDHPPERDMREEMQKISELKLPAVYDRHIHFLDFTKFGYQEPIYVNIVRDPVARFLSQYNYMKYGDGEGGVKNPATYLPNINACVMEETSLCGTNFMFYIGMYFCGFDKVCDSPSASRVNLAKKHITENYVLIGLTEEYLNTVKLLQKMLPEYFRGAEDAYKKMTTTRQKTTTKIIEVLSEESIDKLKNKLLKDEYEVYNFAKQKFMDLKRKYGIL